MKKYLKTALKIRDCNRIFKECLYKRIPQFNENPILENILQEEFKISLDEALRLIVYNTHLTKARSNLTLVTIGNNLDSNYDKLNAIYIALEFGNSLIKGFKTVSKLYDQAMMDFEFITGGA